MLSVLTFNFFYITPRHQLAIAHSHDFVQLIVLLIAAVVVGRLAAVARQRAAEAESRARTAAAREREAKLLAEVASAILAGHSVESQLHSIGARVATATGASHARLTLEPVPSPGAGRDLRRAQRPSTAGVAVRGARQQLDRRRSWSGCRSRSAG